MFNLNGKVALVTGASYGIGFAIAKGLAQAGAKIVFNDINEELMKTGLMSACVQNLSIITNYERIHMSSSEDIDEIYNWKVSIDILSQSDTERKGGNAYFFRPRRFSRQKKRRAASRRAAGDF